MSTSYFNTPSYNPLGDINIDYTKVDPQGLDPQAIKQGETQVEALEAS